MTDMARHCMKWSEMSWKTHEIVKFHWQEMWWQKRKWNNQNVKWKGLKQQEKKLIWNNIQFSYFTPSNPHPDILFWHSVWNLTFYLPSILTFSLAFCLTYVLTVNPFYLTYILTYYLASILTIYPAFYLTYVLTFYLAFFLAFYLTRVRVQG